ncbi:hypothetical protein ABLN67_10005, partial [Mycobacterium tuberculosis]
GLFGLNVGITIPEFPIHWTSTGGIGPIIIPDTTILPPIHLGLTGQANYGFAVPDIPIPAIHIDFDGAADAGFTAPATTLLSALGITGQFRFGPITVSNVQLNPFNVNLKLQFLHDAFPNEFPDPTISVQIQVAIPLTSATLGGLALPLQQTIDAIELPAISFSQSIPIDIPPIDIPASTINGISMSEVVPIDVSVDIPAVTITGTRIDPIPLNFDVLSSAGPINISIIDIPALPGFGNSTELPSSGFFNTGGGGGSGIANFGAGVSGLLNQASSPMVGTLSGLGNAGSLASGVLNSGVDISGMFNVSTLGSAPAVISGFGNLGNHVSGVSIDGLLAMLTSGGSGGSGQPSIIDAAIAELRHLNPLNIVNLGNVGSYNLGFANVGDVNLGAGNLGNLNLGGGNLGGQNLGLGNLGDGNVGFGNLGHGNVGFR